MKDAEEPPCKYGKENRAAWFGGEVQSHVRYGRSRYAGRWWISNFYNVYRWGGTHEVVPEEFLMPKPADSCSNHSAGMVSLGSGHVGPAFWKAYNTPNRGIGCRKI